MQVADYAGVPRPIMTYLLEDEISGNMNDIRLITNDDVKEIRGCYQSKYKDEPEKLRIWTQMATNHFKYMVDWFNSYHPTNGRSPDIDDLSRENFLTLPDEVAMSNERFNYGTLNPGRPFSNVTVRRSSMMSQGSQVTSKRNVKVSITDYPKFTGKAKDWIAFERKLISSIITGF